MPYYEGSPIFDIAYRSDLTPREREVYEVLDLIVAEFESDPMSVQCFDLRTVDRAKMAVEWFRKLKASP